MLRRTGTCACLALCLSAVAVVARAQDVRDVVRGHLANELEDQPAKTQPAAAPASPPSTDAEPAPPPASEPAAPPSGESAPPPGDVAFTLSTDGPKYTGPSLPQRVFGRQFEIDLKLGAGYRGWQPQQYPTVKVAAGSYYVWTIDVRARIMRWLILRRGYYESNELSGPRTNEAAVATQVGEYVPKAAWVLGVLGFPITEVWEPIIRYESRAFRTSAQPSEPVCVVNDKVAGDLASCPRSTTKLNMISGFETFVLGVRYDKSKDHSPGVTTRTEPVPPMTFGIGLMSYRKPYQVTVGQNTLKEYLFDGRFKGGGLAFATDVGGGVYRLFLDLDMQVGLGQVNLTKNLTLNSLAPEDWLIGYLQGNVTVGYNLPIWRAAPTLMFVPQGTIGGASFYFFKPNQKASDQSDAKSLNWDLLWSVHAQLVLSL